MDSQLWTPHDYNRQGQVEIPLHDVTLTSGLKLRFRGLQRVESLDTTGTIAVYERDGLRVIASLDHTPRFGPLLHVSVSRQTRYPSWDELVQVKAAFHGDDVDAMMVMPRSEDYINVHESAFHIWQCPVGWRLQ